jgi:regulator of sigma E protease
MLLTIVTFFVVLTILVMIHEFGHYTVARLIGVKVEEFGLGLPPRAFGKKIKGTIYSINWLPIGGFVKLAGEDDEEGEQKAESRKQKADSSLKTRQYFWARSKKERSAILIAGVCMNFLLAVAITAGLLVNGVNEPSGKVRIEKVAPGSPAEQVGIKSGDVILSVQAALESSQPKSIKASQDLIDQTSKNLGNPTVVRIDRNGQNLSFLLTPRKNPPKNEGAMGVQITDLEMKKYSLIEAPYAALKINLERGWQMLTGIVSTLWNLVTLKKMSADVAGPIGIAQVTGQAVKFGFRAVLDFMSILSLNLAILNILPIPALDGGRLAFVFVEKIIGRKVRPAFERQTHQIGMIILLLLVALVSFNDIMRLVRGG